MDRRQPQDIHVPLYNNGIGPGAARVVHYRVQVPAGRVGLDRAHGRRSLPEVLARLHDLLARRRRRRRCPSRRSPQRHRRPPAHAARSPESRRPAVRDDRERGNADPPWLRWNDYGIGLFLQGDLQGRGAAPGRSVAELAPDKPDGPLNRARAPRSPKGGLADAKRSLVEAEKRRPGWGKTAFFRSIVAKDEGRLDDAERDLKFVLAKFPLDRVAWNNLGLDRLARRPLPARRSRRTRRRWRSTPRT